MAQLKDTIITGSLRVTDTTYTNNLNLSSGTASLIVKTDASKNLITGSLAASEIPNLSANKITSDTLSADRIPNLAASKINSGTFDAARIPNLAASKINSGTFDAARIPTLSITDKTSGTLTVARGGTGKESWTQWGVLYASASTTLTNTAAGTAGYLLQGNGAAAPSWILATNSNTASTIVKRDASGNFSAGTITASLTGNVTGYSTYLPTRYDSGVKTNPLQYFGKDIGLRVAMTGSWSTWSDTLWINGYSGGDVKDMCALHFKRNGTPRMSITTQKDDATAYGKYYEIFTTYNGDYTYSSTIEYYPGTRQVYKTGTTNAWDAQFYSNIGYKECKITFLAGTTGKAIMVGLNSDPSTDANYASIDYCWYLQNGTDKGLCIYESGTSINSITGHTTYAIGDEFSIEYVDGYVRYFHNGVCCRTVARALGSLLYVDSSFHGANGYVYNLRFLPVYNTLSYAYLKRHIWWNSGNGNNVDTLRSGCTFAYTNHKAPTNGTIVSFDCATNTDYTLQILGQYGGNRLFYRNRNGDNGTWPSWRRIVTAPIDKNSSNAEIDFGSTTLPVYINTAGEVVKCTAYGSASVNYATSSGSCTGNAATATSATLDGAGNEISSYYVTLTTDQTGISGSKRFTKAVQCYRYGTNNNLPAITMDKPGSYYVGIGADGTSHRIKFGPCSDLAGSSWVAESTFNSNEWYFQGTVTATVAVKNAVWNDYAEYRRCDELSPGMCVLENDDGKLTASNHRLIPACSIITDTFGFIEGETDDAKTPVAVAGRVLAYTYLPRRMYHAGMAVCSAPGGTIDIMTREEIRDYPDCIIGYVSEIPDYEYWGSGNVKVNGRIWIKVK